jgi:hypothetical protein
MAGYRSRLAKRRSARARDSIRISALRDTWRGDDRKRHYLSRAFCRAGSWKGDGVR